MNFPKYICLSQDTTAIKSGIPQCLILQEAREILMESAPRWVTSSLSYM